jgi:hypothetical protein
MNRPIQFRTRVSLWSSFAVAAMALLSSPRARAQTPPPPTTQIVIGSYSDTDGFGDSQFGSGYTLSASVRGTQAVAGNRTRYQADLSTWGRVFGNTGSFVSAEAKIETNTAWSVPRLTYQTMLLGFVNATLTVDTEIEVEQTIFDEGHRVARYTQPFEVGGVPLEVTVDVYARASLLVGGTLNRFGGEAHIRPLADLSTRASLAVGIADFVEAGVRGTLSLLHAEVPTQGAMRWSYQRNACPGGINTDKLTGSATSDLILHSLDGKLSVYAGVFGIELEHTIFSWDGFQKTYPLFSAQKVTVLPAIAPAPEGAPGISSQPTLCPRIDRLPFDVVLPHPI